MSGDAPDRAELGSRDDVLFDQGLEALRTATASLAISLKTCRRSTDNPVFRMSAEQQLQQGMQQLRQLFSLPSVPYEEDAGQRLGDALAPFVQLVAQVTWLPAADAEVTTLFQERADAVFAPDRIAVVGRPSRTFATLLASRARLPEPPPSTPSPEQPVPPAPDAPVLLHETLFTHGGGQGSPQPHVGGMYLAVLVHVRGLSEQQAKQSISPAALMGFAQSIEKALGGQAGLVAFRIVRANGKVEMQLRRMSSQAS